MTTGNSDTVSLGEISRRLDRFEQTVSGDLAEVRQSVAAVGAQSVPLGQYLAERQADKDEVANVKAEQLAQAGRISWAWRTALTSFIAPIVVGLVVVVMRGGAG